MHLIINYKLNITMKKTACILFSTIILLQVSSLHFQRRRQHNHISIKQQEMYLQYSQLSSSSETDRNSNQNHLSFRDQFENQLNHQIWFFTNWNQENSNKQAQVVQESIKNKKQATNIKEKQQKSQQTANSFQLVRKSQDEDYQEISSDYVGENSSENSIIDKGNKLQPQIDRIGPLIKIQDSNQQSEEQRDASQNDNSKVSNQATQKRVDLYKAQTKKLSKFKKAQDGCLMTPYTKYCPEDLERINRNIFQDTYVLINQKPYQYDQDFGLVCTTDDNQIKIQQSTKFIAKDSCEGPEACANMILKFKSLCKQVDSAIWKVPFLVINFADFYFQDYADIQWQQLVNYLTKQQFQAKFAVNQNQNNKKQGKQEEQEEQGKQGQAKKQSELKPRFLQPHLVYDQGQKSHLHNLYL